MFAAVWQKQLTDATKIDVKEFQILNIQQARETGTARVLLHGPPGGPYQGYAFQMQYISSGDPHIPPKVKFINIPWNPYIDLQNGKICCDIFTTQKYSNKYSGWSPALKLNTVLLCISSLLGEDKMPQNEPGLNMQAAADMRLKYSIFFEKARNYAQTHHYKKQIIYTDQEKPPGIHPQDKNIQDIQYMEEKQTFMNSVQLKQIYNKKKMEGEQ